ncbi:hypothetical protein INR49_024425 [Caranx melampygus]|nr:hypothetical protein INR49_024425 [Caranx melampygus]
MPGVGSDLGNVKSVSLTVCVARASHTAGTLGLSADVCFHSVPIFFSPYRNSDRLIRPTHTYSSLSPFLDFALKEDKKSGGKPRVYSLHHCTTREPEREGKSERDGKDMVTWPQKPPNNDWRFTQGQRPGPSGATGGPEVAMGTGPWPQPPTEAEQLQALMAAANEVSEATATLGPGTMGLSTRYSPQFTLQHVPDYRQNVYIPGSTATLTSNPQQQQATAQQATQQALPPPQASAQPEPPKAAQTPASKKKSTKKEKK